MRFSFELQSYFISLLIIYGQNWLQSLRMYVQFSNLTFARIRSCLNVVNVEVIHKPKEQGSIILNSIGLYLSRPRTKFNRIKLNKRKLLSCNWSWFGYSSSYSCCLNSHHCWCKSNISHRIFCPLRDLAQRWAKITANNIGTSSNELKFRDH